MLLRGINVGGRSRLAMADLRAALEAADFEDVSTYLQSGNAVVSVPGRSSAASVADRVRSAFDSHLPWSPAVVVFSGTQLAAVVEGNPWPEAVAEPKLLNVAFLSTAPDPTARLDPAAWAPDEWAFADSAIYLRYVGSSPGRSRLAEVVCREALRARPEAVVTVRNWNTVREMAARTS